MRFNSAFKGLKVLSFPIILLSVTILLLPEYRPLNATSFAFCTDIVKRCRVIVLLNSAATFCKLSSMLNITTSSSANTVTVAYF